MASVTNSRHLLAEDGTIAPDSDPEWTLAKFFVGIVAWVTRG